MQTNRRSTRRSLLVSATALILSIAMLVGTTFAWFTDTVSSGVNKIQAGNLDIEVEYEKPNGSWETIEGKQSLFSSNLWEPGHTEFVTLKIENKGTLALKYKVLVTPVSENGGVNVKGESFKLSDYLVFGTTNPVTECPNYTRDTVRDAVGGTAGLSDVNNLTKTENLVGKDATGYKDQYMTLVVYMPESVGNEANYKTGTTAPTIDLGIKVIATQVENEDDSFGTDYDKDADKDPDFIASGTLSYNYAPQVSLTGMLKIDSQGKEISTEGATAAKDGETVQSYTIKSSKNVPGSETPDATVTIPKDAINWTTGEDQNQVAEVKFEVKPDTTYNLSESGITISDDETGKTLDIKVTGLVENNSAVLVAEAFYAKNLTGVKLYHNATQMTEKASKAEVTGADEFYYDASSGMVTLGFTSCSPFTAIYKDVAVALVDEKTYTSLQQAVDAAQDSATVTLLKDITLSETLSVSKRVTLNMNGKNIVGDQVRAIHVKSGRLTLDGSGTVSSTGIDVDSSVIRVGDNGTKSFVYLYVNEGVTISTDCSYGITAFGNTYEFVHVHGTVTSTAPENNSYDGCAISTLGTDTTTSYIRVYDGATVSAANTNGIYMPSGDLIVKEGATVTGRTGIYVKSGSTTIEGGTITGNGSAVAYNYYGNGGISTGDALVVDSCGYPNGKPSVSVTGGNFISANAKAVASYNTEGNAHIDNFVSGGTFSSDPSDCLLFGYQPVSNGNIWTVSKITSTAENPIHIKNESDWLGLAEQAYSVSGTEGQYYVVDKDLDFTGVTKKAGFRYFAGSINFQEHKVSGLTGSNTYTYRYPSLFKYVKNNATIKNLKFELPNLGTDKTVKPIGSIQGTGTVTLENIAISGNLNMTDNNTGLLVDFIGGKYDYTSKFEGTLKLVNCTSTCNMVNNGFSSVFIGGIYYGGNNITLNATDCVNYGKILSTGSAASMLISNGTCYTGDKLTLNITNCRNEGQIIAAPGKSAHLVMPDVGSERAFYTGEQIEAFETSGAIVNANGGIATSLEAGNLVVTNGKFDLMESLKKAPDAATFKLVFGFQGTGGLGGGGVTQYTFTFGSRDAVVNVPAYPWVNASEATGELTANNNFGTTYYTDAGNHYVYNQSGYIMSRQPEVSFVAYDGEGNVILVDYYTYHSAQ